MIKMYRKSSLFPFVLVALFIMSPSYGGPQETNRKPRASTTGRTFWSERADSRLDSSIAQFDTPTPCSYILDSTVAIRTQTEFNFPIRASMDTMTGRKITLFVALHIDTSGKVVFSDVIASQGPEFNSFTKSAARTLQFTPPTSDGKKVSIYVYVQATIEKSRDSVGKPIFRAEFSPRTILDTNDIPILGPSLLTMAKPIFNDALGRFAKDLEKERGKMTARVWINSDGRPIHVRFAYLDNPRLARVALQTILKSKFSAATYLGQPIVSFISLPFEFNIH